MPAAKGSSPVKDINTFWLLGAGLAAAFLLYGTYLYAFFQWHASVEAIRAVARLAMHETARDIAANAS